MMYIMGGGGGDKRKSIYYKVGFLKIRSFIVATSIQTVHIPSLVDKIFKV